MSLYENAIIEAKQIREAAEKVATAKLIEQHSDKVKGIVDQMINEAAKDPFADDDEDFGDEMFGEEGLEDPIGFDTLDDEEGEPTDSFPNAMPAFPEDESFCPCEKGKEKEIELDFSDLQKAIAGEAESEYETHEDVGEEVLDGETEGVEDDEDITSAMPGKEKRLMEEDLDLSEDDIMEALLEMDVDEESNPQPMGREDDEDVIDEEVNVDFGDPIRPSGKMGQHGRNASEEQEQIDMAIAANQDDDIADNLDSAKKVEKELNEGSEVFSLLHKPTLSHLAGGGAQGELEAVVEYIKSKYQDFEGVPSSTDNLARMTSFANEMAKEFSMTPDQAEMVIAYVSSYLALADESKDALNEFNPSGSYQMLGVAKKVDGLVKKGHTLEQAMAKVAKDLGRSAEEVKLYYDMESKNALNEIDRSGYWYSTGVLADVQKLMKKGKSYDEAAAVVAKSLDKEVKDVKRMCAFAKKGKAAADKKELNEGTKAILGEAVKIPTRDEEIEPYLNALATAGRNYFGSFGKENMAAVQRIFKVANNAARTLPKNKNISKTSTQIENMWSEAMRRGSCGDKKPTTGGTSLQESKNILAEQNGKLKSLLEEAGRELGRSNTNSAILLYENQVLSNGSLNERQKKRFSRAIASAKTAEEAKRLHEALVGAATDKRAEGDSGKVTKDQTLSETLERKSGSHVSMTGKPIQEEPTINQSMKDHFKKLTFPTE